jgi:hypothetical protein
MIIIKQFILFHATHTIPYISIFLIKLIDDIDKKTREMGGWNRFKYLNYAAWRQEQDVFEGYKY